MFNWSMPHQSQVLWLSHFTVDLDLSYNKLTGTLPTQIGNMNQLRKLLCTHCLNSLMYFAFSMILCLSLLWIYYLKIESVNWLISHHLQVLWLSYFIGSLNLEGNQLILSADWIGISKQTKKRISSEEKRTLIPCHQWHVFTLNFPSSSRNLFS